MLQTNTVVLASAGTGKTRKLVDVYLGLLETGVDPMRIVAMTFTEKAAAEMRDRIRITLSDRAERWARVITILGAAPISTIHGFCGILLREHGFAIGIDPSFTILDEQRSLDVARDSAREVIRQEIRSGNEDVEVLFADFGLEHLVETLISAGHWLSSLGVDAYWLDKHVEEQAQAAARLEAELANEVLQYGEDFEAIGNLADELESRKVRHPLRKRDEACALLPKIGQIAGVTPARRLSRLTGIFINLFTARKRSLNAMDFDDLLVGARDLLKGHPAVRRHYQDHFQAFLIDEFQDTDEVQAEIISLLAEDPTDPGRFAPQKLMIVGDPKQSIYRFRRARVTVFFRMLQQILDQGGAIEHLQANYRSAAPLVELSNRLSKQMMDGRGKTDDLSDTCADLSYRIRFDDSDVLKPQSDAPFLGITYVAAESGAKAAHGREMEAVAIARLLKQWKASGLICSWKEVAVLLRAMTNVEIYLSALEAQDIPVHVVQGTAFYQKTEVSDLIAFLELVLHPEDELLRTIVLTSSLVGASFDHLLSTPSPSGRGRRAEGARVRVAGSEPILLPSPVILNHLLEPWLEIRDRATAAEILQDVIRKTNFDVVMTAQKDGQQRVANIGKLIEITRELARQGTTALDDVVRYLRDRAHDMTVRESEAQIAGQDDDVVRVLTVHQAKGLEFDIVVLPDLAAKTGRGNGDRVFFSDRWGMLVAAAYGLHRKCLPHSLILEAKELDDDQQYEEEKRLLYVAVTRPKKMLVLGEGFSKHGGPWLDWITELFEAAQPGALEKARGGEPVLVRFHERSECEPDAKRKRDSAQPQERAKPVRNQFLVKLVPASQLNLPEQLTFTAEPIRIGEPHVPFVPPPQTILSLEMTPSDLASLSGCFRYFHWTRILGIGEPGRSSTGDTPQMRLGSIVHKMLENPVAPSVSDLAAAGVADLGSLFESSEWRDLVSVSPEREMPFIMHIDVDGKDCWVRGRMDAVVTGRLPRVVDYKYAMWHKGAEATYDIQMTAYSLALMKALGTERAVGELWYLKAPMKVIRREYTVAEAEQLLRQLFSSYFTALRSNEWPLADRSYCDSVECGFRSQCWAKSEIRNSQFESA